MPIHEKIYERLKDVARESATITYSEIAPLAALNLENPAHRNMLGEILGEISTYELENNRPMLSSIVVHSDDRLPGEGFFILARFLGKYHGQGEIADMEFFVDQVKRVYSYWQS
jgi:hypothetical protein